MARRTRSRGMFGGLLNKRMMWYAIYGIAGYYAYQWWMGQQSMQIAQPMQSIAIPEPTVSAFPY